MTRRTRTIFLVLNTGVCLFSSVLAITWSYLIVIPYWDSFSIFDFDMVLTLPVFILSTISILSGWFAIRKANASAFERISKAISFFAMIVALISMAALLLPGIVFRINGVFDPPDHTVVLKVSLPSNNTDIRLLEKTRQLVSARIRYYAEPFDTRIIPPDKIALTVRKSGRLTKEKLQEILNPGDISFHLVHKDNAGLIKKKNRFDGFIPPEGYALFFYRSAAYFIKTRPEMIPNIKDATARTGASGKPFMLIEFKPEAADHFSDLTARNIGRRLAILVDNRIRSILVIQKAIKYGLLNITGDFTLEAATDLSFALKSGPIPANIQIMDARKGSGIPMNKQSEDTLN